MHELEAAGPVVRVGEVPEALADQLVLAAAEQLLEGGVGQGEPAGGVGERHAGAAVLEAEPETGERVLPGGDPDSRLGRLQRGDDGVGLHLALADEGPRRHLDRGDAVEVVHLDAERADRTALEDHASCGNLALAEHPTGVVAPARPRGRHRPADDVLAPADEQLEGAVVDLQHAAARRLHDDALRQRVEQGALMGQHIGDGFVSALLEELRGDGRVGGEQLTGARHGPAGGSPVEEHLEQRRLFALCACHLCVPAPVVSATPPRHAAAPSSCRPPVHHVPVSQAGEQAGDASPLRAPPSPSDGPVAPAAAGSAAPPPALAL